MFFVSVQSADGVTKPFNTATSKVVLVGRNYVAHAKELDNPIPKTPLLFIKSTNCLVALDGEIKIPSDQGECHHELEVAILIDKQLKDASENESIEAISAIGIGLDLTLRDLQADLKSKGQPWEKAKSFDGACPLSEFIDFKLLLENLSNSDDEIGKGNYAHAVARSALSNIDFELSINGASRQKGNTSATIFDIPYLLSYISKYFSLYPGDVILTGTPEGVAELKAGDRLEVSLNETSLASANIIVN